MRPNLGTDSDSPRTTSRLTRDGDEPPRTISTHNHRAIQREGRVGIAKGGTKISARRIPRTARIGRKGGREARAGKKTPDGTSEGTVSRFTSGWSPNDDTLGSSAIGLMNGRLRQENAFSSRY